MLKALLRFLAGVLMMVAVIAAVNDVTRAMTAGHAVAPLSLHQHWSGLAPKTLDLARSAVERKTHPLLWEMGVAKMLELPTWGLFGLAGLLLAYAGRRRREINIFAN